MDKETMLRMVKRMSQTLTEFKSMGNTSQSNQTFTNSNNNNMGRQTAKEFFSKENKTHPAVEENMNLKKKLKQLEQARQMGGAVSLNNLNFEKSKVE
jgi:ABC-type phosphate transport system ATPase subunit